MKDLIIDCFAGGGGASVGIEMALGRKVDIAIDHDPEAIKMHMVNHPQTLHLTEDIFKVDLKNIVGDRKVSLMWASPDCTSYSVAAISKHRRKEKMDFMQGIPRYTVTYCQYGDTRMKPTDIWTNHPDPQFKPPCHYGDPCHVPAPRGAKTGTQGLVSKIEKAVIPLALCEHIVEICERG